MPMISSAKREQQREQFLSDTESLMFSQNEKEYEYHVKSSWIEGNIPLDIRGTYYRNGAGNQPPSGRGKSSPLDGDGMVISLAIQNGKAYFKSRYVRTKGFMAEQRAGQKLFRTPFSKGSAGQGTPYNPLDLAFKNVANTNVIHWNGRLYALWEAGRPYELDPRSLETLGESTLGGILSPSSPDPIAGHYRVIYDQEGQGGKRLVLFGTDVTLHGMKVKFLEIDEEGRCVGRADHVIGGMDTTFIHDMLLTPSYYIILMGPTRFNWVRFATEYLPGLCSIAQCISYDKGGKARAILVPRATRGREGRSLREVEGWEGGSRPQVTSQGSQGASQGWEDLGSDALVVEGREGAGKRAPHKGRETLVVEATEGFFPFHHVNAYEEGEEVVIDTLGWDSIDFDTVMDASNAANGKSPARRYLRWRLNKGGKGRHVSIEEMRTEEGGSHRNCEFPVIDPMLTGLKHEEVICACDTSHGIRGTTQALIKLAFPPSSSPSPSSPFSLSSSPSTTETSRAGGTSVGGKSSSKGLRTIGYYDPGPRRYCGEPCLIPKSTPSQPSGQGSEPRSQPSQPSGQGSEPRSQPSQPSQPSGQGSEPRSFWVIVSVHDAATLKAEICILDGDDLSAGPVAVLRLPHTLPMSLHGCFINQFMGPGEEDAASADDFFRSMRVISNSRA